MGAEKVMKSRDFCQRYPEKPRYWIHKFSQVPRWVFFFL